MVVKGKQQKQLNLVELPTITSADECDNAIRDAALVELQIDELETALNARLAEVQNQFVDRIKTLKADYALREAQILAFAKKNRDALFGDKKSRKFNFGTIAFSKAASAVKFLLDEIEIIANLKKLGRHVGVVKQKEWVAKNAIVDAVPEKDREKVGFELVTTGDKPTLKIDRKAIELIRAARKAS